MEAASSRGRIRGHESAPADPIEHRTKGSAMSDESRPVRSAHRTLGRFAAAVVAVAAVALLPPGCATRSAGPVTVRVLGGIEQTEEAPFPADATILVRLQRDGVVLDEVTIDPAGPVRPIRSNCSMTGPRPGGRGSSWSRCDARDGSFWGHPRACRCGSTGRRPCSPAGCSRLAARWVPDRPRFRTVILKTPREGRVDH